jgi:hypothetical protein
MVFMRFMKNSREREVVFQELSSGISLAQNSDLEIVIAGIMLKKCCCFSVYIERNTIGNKNPFCVVPSPHVHDIFG